jgi:hypothetical protein
MAQASLKVPTSASCIVRSSVIVAFTCFCNSSMWPDPEAERFTSSIFENMGALCFSRTWSNPPLWSHYADKHKGICLGLDIPDEPGAWEKPIYVDSPEIEEPALLLESINTAHAQGNYQEALRVQEEFIGRKLLLKCSGWRYEDEVRLFARLDGKSGEPSYFDFDEKLALREVIAGVRCTVTSSEIEEKLRDYSPPIKILKARLSFESFQVIEDPRTSISGLNPIL